jgi:hypothetical protein
MANRGAITHYSADGSAATVDTSRVIFIITTDIGANAMLKKVMAERATSEVGRGASTATLSSYYLSYHVVGAYGALTDLRFSTL